MYSKYINWQLKRLQYRIAVERHLIDNDRHNMSHATLYRHVYKLDKLQKRFNRLSGRNSK